MKRVFAAAAASAVALSLSACGSTGGEDSNTVIKPKIGSESYDVSGVKADKDIAAMVPAEIKERGVLRNLASTDYAPGEFRSVDDDQTPVGYDIDMVRAIALVMGLQDGSTEHADFESLLPKIGTQADIGVSSFTINSERTVNYNMISYVQAGSQFATAKGNPNGFDSTNPCGKNIGVQTGTYQETEELPSMSEECVAAGKAAINIVKHKLQTEVAPKVASGQLDATFADSQVIGYMVKQAGDQLEAIGDIKDAAPQGIVVPQDDEKLTKAVQAALQKLMDDGTLKNILSHYGNEAAMLTEANIYANGES